MKASMCFNCYADITLTAGQDVAELWYKLCEGSEESGPFFRIGGAVHNIEPLLAHLEELGFIRTAEDCLDCIRVRLVYTEPDGIPVFCINHKHKGYFDGNDT